MRQLGSPRSPPFGGCRQTMPQLLERRMLQLSSGGMATAGHAPGPIRLPLQQPALHQGRHGADGARSQRVVRAGGQALQGGQERAGAQGVRHQRPTRHDAPAARQGRAGMQGGGGSPSRPTVEQDTSTSPARRLVPAAALHPAARSASCTRPAAAAPAPGQHRRRRVGQLHVACRRCVGARDQHGVHPGGHVAVGGGCGVLGHGINAPQQLQLQVAGVLTTCNALRGDLQPAACRRGGRGASRAGPSSLRGCHCSSRGRLGASTRPGRVTRSHRRVKSRHTRVQRVLGVASAPPRPAQY